METYLKEAISKETPNNVSFHAVAGLQLAKTILQENVIAPIQGEELPNNQTSKLARVLLYGAPGTGKSMLGKATAAESSKARFFSISSSDLISKYVGNGEKILTNLFEMARQYKPSLILIDDIDMICWDSTGASKSKQEFLSQIESCSQINDGIYILATTSVPWKLHADVLEKFETRIYIPLPEAHARSFMFKLHLGNTPNSLTEQDFHKLGLITDGYTGSDICCVARDAQLEPVRKLRNATHFKKCTGFSMDDAHAISNDLLTPCDAADSGAMEINVMDIPSNKLLQMQISMEDVMGSVNNQRGTVTEEDLAKFKQFQNEAEH